MPKLFYIAGHGAGDPGATGNKYQEAERVRALGNRLKAIGGANVILGDFNRNYYVIINAGFTADKYDSSLAAMLARILPGRANMIVGRNDLANPSRAAARGYNYRLVEFGFITNAEDVRIFNSRMDDIACGILDAFGIGKLELKSEEEEDMREIVQAKNGKGQYYFDGYALHGFSSGAEKKVIMDMYKRHTGRDLKTHVYSDEDFEKLAKVLARNGK